jgi:hypothetical protein
MLPPVSYEQRIAQLEAEIEHLRRLVAILKRALGVLR